MVAVACAFAIAGRSIKQTRKKWVARYLNLKLSSLRFKFFESVQNSMTGLYSRQKITVNKKFNELAI
jgi:hypothetical protein